MKLESIIQQEIRLIAGKYGVRLFRNNIGACKDNTGRLIRYGLGNDSAQINKVMASSDLIGVMPGGQFVSIECKREGWKYTGTTREQAQLKWIEFIQSMGGLAGFAASIDDFVSIIGGVR